MKCCKNRKRCCNYPKCLLCPMPKAPSPQAEKIKKYLALPFPEDDF